jgi:protein SCO1/2
LFQLKKYSGNAGVPKKAKSEAYGLALPCLPQQEVVFYIYFYAKNEREKKVSWFSDASRSRSHFTSPALAVKTIGTPKIGGNFTLVDQDGIPRTSNSFKGDYILVYFGFTYCPDICPTELTKMAAVVNNIDAAFGPVIQPLFISVDPWRDDVARVRGYVKNFHPRMIGLTGTPDQVQQVTKAYRVYYSKPPQREENEDYLLDHSIFIYMLDRDGKFLDYFGVNKDVVEITQKVKQHIRERDQLPESLLERIKALWPFGKEDAY